MLKLTRRNLLLLMPSFLVACQTGGQLYSPRDEGTIHRVETYLNDPNGIKANFIQIWPNETESTGLMTYLPGRLRLDYQKPSSMIAVAKDKHMIIKEQQHQSITRIGLARNPLGLLLKSPVRLVNPILVTAIQQGSNALQISLASSDNPSQGLLTLSFEDVRGILILNQMQAVDVRGNHTQLHFYNVQPAGKVSDSYFVYPDL